MRVGIEGTGVLLRLDDVERGVLGTLSRDLAELLRADGDPDADPVLRRLLPDAYPDDAAASAEFRRYTADGLTRRKAADADLLAADVAGDGSGQQHGDGAAIALDAAAGDRWLRTLTDLRLALAERIGIRLDGDEPPTGPQGAAYQWLGELQWRLVDALDELPGR